VKKDWTCWTQILSWLCFMIMNTARRKGNRIDNVATDQIPFSG
jgi:hypothetical protein